MFSRFLRLWTSWDDSDSSSQNIQRELCWSSSEVLPFHQIVEYYDGVVDAALSSRSTDAVPRLRGSPTPHSNHSWHGSFFHRPVTSTKQGGHGPTFTSTTRSNPSFVVVSSHSSRPSCLLGLLDAGKKNVLVLILGRS